MNTYPGFKERYLLILILVAICFLGSGCDTSSSSGCDTSTICQKSLAVADTQSAQIYYPCDIEERSAPLGATTLMGRTSDTASDIAWLAEEIAAADFVVLTATPRIPQDRQALISDWKKAHIACFNQLKSLGQSDPIFMGKIDAQRLQVMGYAQGGEGAFSSAADLRHVLKSSIFINPTRQSTTPLTAHYPTSAMLLLAGDGQERTDIWEQMPDYSPKAYIQYNPTSFLAWSDSKIDRSRLSRDAIAWMKYYLDEDASQQGDIADTAKTSFHQWDLGYTPQQCPLAADLEYFKGHPTVAAATVQKFEKDPDILPHFCIYMEQLENTGRIQIDEPYFSSKVCIEPDDCIYISLSLLEQAQILAAKTAHAIWLDRHQIVPWRLDAYTPKQLDQLFQRDFLFEEDYTYSYFGIVMEHSFYSVVDYSPSDVYAYIQERQLIGTDMLSTVHKVMDDLRTTGTHRNFYHGVSGRDPSTAYTLYDALTSKNENGDRISRMGCGSMTRIVLGLLRSMNIPGLETHEGIWYTGTHSSAVLSLTPTALVLPHGDDLYGPTYYEIPTEKFLPTIDFYADSPNRAVCGSDNYCISLRHKAMLLIDYPARWDIERCCHAAEYGYETCSDYLQSQYGANLTPDELVALIESMQGHCE